MPLTDSDYDAANGGSSRAAGQPSVGDVAKRVIRALRALMKSVERRVYSTTTVLPGLKPQNGIRTQAVIYHFDDLVHLFANVRSPIEHDLAHHYFELQPSATRSVMGLTEAQQRRQAPPSALRDCLAP